MKKLLLIEDDEMVRELLAMRLRIAGYEVCEAADGKEGLETLERDSFDLIILDMLMPSMNGLQFLDCAVERFACVPPLIVLSATRVDDEIAPFEAALPGIFVVRKPLGAEALIELVNEKISTSPR